MPSTQRPAMIEIRKSEDRGRADHGWLRSYHTFSFADYYDRENMGFGHLRVINEDRVQPGTGVLHSEFNHARDEVTHFLQIWIEPNVSGIPPSYEQKRFDAESKRGRLRLVVSPDGRDGSVTIHQDAHLYAGLLDGSDRAVQKLQPGRRAYVHVARGRLTVNGQPLEAGDALKATDTAEIVLQQGEGAEVLLFDLA